jgi:hypothetical protein
MKRKSQVVTCPLLLMLSLFHQSAFAQQSCARPWVPGPVIAGEEVSYAKSNYRAIRSARANSQPPSASTLYALIGRCGAISIPKGPATTARPRPAPKPRPISPPKPTSISQHQLVSHFDFLEP